LCRECADIRPGDDAGDGLRANHGSEAWHKTPFSRVASRIVPATTEPEPDDDKILSLFRQWAAAERKRR
jgi:hypothetical protein